MKTEITFKFDDDRFTDNAIRRLTSATDAYLALFDLDQHLRSEIKYKEHSEEIIESLDSIRTKLHEIMEENHINMDDLE